MATYGEPNYKFPTLARAVPNVTTRRAIMATVDLKTLKERAERGAEILKGGDGYVIYCPPDDILALIRRVERLTAALEQCTECDCNSYKATDYREHRESCPYYIANEALKEEPNSVG